MWIWKDLFLLHLNSFASKEQFFLRTPSLNMNNKISIFFTTPWDDTGRFLEVSDLSSIMFEFRLVETVDFGRIYIYMYVCGYELTWTGNSSSFNGFLPLSSASISSAIIFQNSKLRMVEWLFRRQGLVQKSQVLLIGI